LKTKRVKYTRVNRRIDGSLPGTIPEGHKSWPVSLPVLFAFIVGGCNAIAWVGASYSWPFDIGEWFRQNAFETSAARTMLPLLLFLIKGGRTIRSFDRQLLILAIVTFGVMPLLVGANVYNLKFFLLICVPQIANLFIILAISRLSEKQFWSFVMGIVFVCVVLTSFGLFRAGFEATIYHADYRIRTRILLGFLHPIPAASSIVAILVVVPKIAKNYQHAISLRNKKILYYIFCGLMIAALYCVNSRNVMMSLCGGVIVYFIRKKKSKGLSSITTICIAFAIASIYSAVFFLTYEELSYLLSWDIGSGLYRLFDFKRNLTAIMNRPFWDILLPSDVFFNTASHGDTPIRFNFTDSVYLSYLGGFGLLATAMLLLCLLYLFNRLNRTPATGWGLGALVACLIFYCFDAQGITMGNLIYFSMLSFAFRTAFCGKRVFRKRREWSRKALRI